MTAVEETLVLYSKLAFYPVHWQALEQIVARYRVRAVALSAPAPELPSVHEAHGTAEADGGSVEVRRMPAGSRRARVAWLARQLRDLSPDAIWVQEEPIDPFCLEILALYRLRRRPRIATAVCENIFPPPRHVDRLVRRALWPRLDHLLAVAGPSVEGIRAAGMPGSVPASSLVAGGLEPPSHVGPLALPFAGSDFVVGFAGRIVEEKGWRVLVSALERLPAEFKLAFAGDGPDVEVLQAALPGRCHYAGLLPKQQLWSFYAALDCLAVPSLTTARWKEQLGGTVLDGLALGVPVVASESGGLPDALGGAGILVAEDDAAALADAVRRLRDDAGLRSRLRGAGRERFRREFAVPAYADKIAAALELRRRDVKGVSAEGLHPRPSG